MSIDNLDNLPALTREDFLLITEICANNPPELFAEQVLGVENAVDIVEELGEVDSSILIAGMMLGYTMSIHDFIKGGIL